MLMQYHVEFVWQTFFREYWEVESFPTKENFCST